MDNAGAGMVVDPRIDRVKYWEEEPSECTYMERYPTQELLKGYLERILKDESYTNPSNPKNNPMLSNTLESIKTYHENAKDITICETSLWGKKGHPLKMAIGKKECLYGAFAVSPYYFIRNFGWNDNLFKFSLTPSNLMCNADGFATFDKYLITSFGHVGTAEWLLNANGTWTVEGVHENYGGSQITGKNATYVSNGFFWVDGETRPDYMCPGNIWTAGVPIIPSWDCGQVDDFCGLVGATAGWVSGITAKVRSSKTLYYIMTNWEGADPAQQWEEVPQGDPAFILEVDPNWEYYGKYSPPKDVLLDKDLWWPYIECDGEWKGKTY